MEFIGTAGPACHASFLVSKSGKRLPLRAIPYRELNTRFWSRGLVAYPDALERVASRELAAFERPVESLTLQELIDTQGSEPLSESRKSFLSTGQGVLHLDASDYEEGSIGEMIADQIDLNSFEDEAEFADEASSIGNGIAYEILDPITAKQIDWEQRAWHTGPVHTLKLADGKVRIDRPVENKEKFLDIARLAASKLLPKAAPAAHLDHAVVAKLAKKFESFVSNEVDRHMSSDDDVMHGSFQDLEGLVHVHSPRGLSIDDRKNGPWHGTVQDRAEVSIFGSVESDEDIEALAAGSTPCPTCDWGMVTGENANKCNACYASDGMTALTLA